jgi:hypothetical protein
VITNPSVYRVHHLERLPLKTPFPAQVARVQYIKSRLPRDAALVVDDTGVGKGIGDMFEEIGLSPVRVSIVHGLDTHINGSRVTVPKATLVSTLVARMHGGELFVHESLKEWPVLRRELLNFRPEMTRSGVETWNARSGEHDDLVLALALAVWHLTGAHIPYRGLLDYYRREAGNPGSAEQWAIGVDLGQSVDPTAIAVLSKIDHPGMADVRTEPFRQEVVSAP